MINIQPQKENFFPNSEFVCVVLWAAYITSIYFDTSVFNLQREQAISSK